MFENGIPPIVWVAVGLSVIVGFFKESKGDPKDQIGCIAILIVIVVVVLLLCGVDDAGEWLKWLMEPGL